jgi:peptidoglycan/LPS O-acetylase OafA/YrhL
MQHLLGGRSVRQRRRTLAGTVTRGLLLGCVLMVARWLHSAYADRFADYTGVLWGIATFAIFVLGGLSGWRAKRPGRPVPALFTAYRTAALGVLVAACLLPRYDLVDIVLGLAGQILGFLVCTGMVLMEEIFGALGARAVSSGDAAMRIEANRAERAGRHLAELKSAMSMPGQPVITRKPGNTGVAAFQ